jgi:hypothetical protein
VAHAHAAQFDQHLVRAGSFRIRVSRTGVAPMLR